ncbi:MAG: porin [Planctomycetaceae bacterium]|nr:porin [Planctomycetaceae bacterium]
MSKSRISFYGWLQTGISVNEYGQKNRYDSPLVSPTHRQLSAYSANSHLLMMEQQSDLKVNQLWFGVQRQIDNRREFDWGFVSDLIYGTDPRVTQCFGDKTFDYDWGQGDYYLAFTNLYGEIKHKNLTIRVGKFNSETSYEPIAAPPTFFYTRARAFFNSVPISGVRAAYKVSDRLTVLGSWTTGELTSFQNRFDDNGFLFQVRFSPTKSTALNYGFFVERCNGLNKQADAPNYGRFYRTQDTVSHHLVYIWDINSRWRYVMEGFANSNSMHLMLGEDSGHANGFNLNLFYKFNKYWSVGTRYEFFKACKTLYDLPHLTGGSGTEINTVSFAVNWQPTFRLNFRAEVRHDWTDYNNGYKPFDGCTESNQLMFGTAMTVKF